MVNISKILICIDGEPHTAKAEEYALTLAKVCGAVLVGLYVINPFLKKFTNEIYAINRDECREYLDRSLTEEGEIALRNFFEKGRALNVVTVTKMRYGDPEEEILDEIKVGNYDLVVMGGKILKTWKERFESFNLSEKIFRKSPSPILIVR